MIAAKTRRPKPRKPSRRSEVTPPRHSEEIWNRQKIREIDNWLLRSGLSPEASRPMSEIGIYTDFT